jgi:hypothetical protein
MRDRPGETAQSLAGPSLAPKEKSVAPGRINTASR